MTEKLTPQQKLAVENRGGPLLVSAAAGSGKTKVLVDRLLSYILDAHNPANIDEFLIITYTKAAAAELRTKIADKLSQCISEQPQNRHLQKQMQRIYLAKISTVHSFCADILREYAYKLNLASDFRIAEESECAEIKFRVIDQLLNVTYAEVSNNTNLASFINTQGLGRDDRLVHEIILQVYSSALCHLRPDEWLNQCCDGNAVLSACDLSETSWGKYLITDLQCFLQLQLSSLESCIHCAESVPGMEKPVTLLKDTVLQLKSLAGCDQWDAVVNHPEIQFGTLSFKKEHRGSDLAEQIKAVRNYCKKELEKKLRPFSDSCDDILQQIKETSSASCGLIDLVKRFIQEYTKEKSARRILDFTDIEQLSLDLLLGKQRNVPTAVAKEIGKRFREIMVDEYQDSNEVQDAIFTALAGKQCGRFMVGDVKQSIYQFRLADPDIFLEKYQDYVPAESAVKGNGRKVLLSSNFRSSAGIISAVNDVFSVCMSKKVGGLTYDEGEELREGIPHINLGEAEVELYGIRVESDTYAEEASFVARRILQLLDGSHMVRDGESLREIQPSDIVILLRSPGSVGAEFQYALTSCGIRCTMGGGANILQAPEIEVLRSILEIINNPLQDIPLLSALMSPVFGFTADRIARIRGKNRKISIFESLTYENAADTNHFLSQLNDLRHDAKFCSITQLIDRVLLKTSLRNVYASMDNGLECCRNIDRFLQLAVSFEDTGKHELSFFLEYLSNLEESGFDLTSDDATENCVRIMSIHKSKGLEFPVVFLCGLSRRFNTSDLKKQVLCHKELGLGLSAVNEKQRVRYPTVAKRAIATKIMADTVSEELRVLYVAMTRARDRLIMTFADSNLEDTLHDLAMRMEHSTPETITAGVDCPGAWVLFAAMQRTEASEFFRLGGYPKNRCVREYPWLIKIIDSCGLSGTVSITEIESKCVPQPVINKIRTGLSFQYPFQSAMQIPSKLTATQLKGRFIDGEISENAGNSHHNPIFHFRTPGTAKSISGADRGTAMHTLLQYIRFTCCSDVKAVEGEIERLIDSKLMTLEQSKLIDSKSVVAFFTSTLGRKICDAQEVLREFKFSILDDASRYYTNCEGEEVLLQGVVDCAIIDDNGITIVDFKTDYVTDDTIDYKISAYREQVSAYSRALSRIFEKPVIEAYLYFFHAKKLIPL